MSRLIPFSVVAMVLLMPKMAVAQQNRWANLEQIQQGQKVVVVDQQMKTLNGTFVRVTENDLTIKIKDKETKIDRDSVYRVTTGPQHRGRNALIGLGVGAAVGGILAGTVPGSEELSAGDMAGVVAGVGGLGAGIGALIAPAKTYYRADKVNKAANPPTPSTDQARVSALQ